MTFLVLFHFQDVCEFRSKPAVVGPSSVINCVSQQSGPLRKLRKFSNDQYFDINIVIGLTFPNLKIVKKCYFIR
jgi:hypothetical protein